MDIFKNRQEAGQKLAKALEKYQNSKDVIILALPRGGVVVGYEISKALNLPFDIIVTRKIGAPGNPEYAIGAITETGEGVFNQDEIAWINKDWLAQEVEKEKKEAQRRIQLYRDNRPAPDFSEKTVILVDDGVATGYTMLVAIKAVKSAKPKKIIVAVPHGASDSLNRIRKEVDEVVVLLEPTWYGAVGAFYKEFPQNTDEEIIQLLKTT